LRRVDARFLLPRPPRTASIFGELDAWGEGLEETGVEVLPPGSSADLAVAPAGLGRAALASGAEMVIVEGRGGAAELGRSHYGIRRLLARPTLERSHVFVPLDTGRAASYAVEQWAASDTRRKQARNSIARSLLRAGIFPELSSAVTVAARTSGTPYLVAAARAVGVPTECDWFLTLGTVDSASRNVFHLFPRGGANPEWVLKFARVPASDEPSRSDERGLRLAHETEQGARHAPKFVARFTVDGLDASLETAATGHRLRTLLTEPGPDRDKLRLIDAVATWLVELARETAAPAETLEPERARLLEQVVGPWQARGVDPDVIFGLPPVPAVLQHSDVHCDQVLIRRNGFTVVDWEHARRPGLPLLDLVHFLIDALTVLDGSPGLEHTLRLVRGEVPRSTVLFRWIRTMVDAMHLPDTAVGRIATLLWLEKDEDAVRINPSYRPDMAARWLRDPALGPTWASWRNR
jgi:hypothetical protein